MGINPFLDLTPMADDNLFEKCARIVLEDPNVDAVFISIVPHTGALHTAKEEIEGDNILPEPFKVEISQDPAIFEGKYFITFSTTDKQTGIDYYEVKEGRKDWKRAISPYVLENQKLTSDIWVKAIDKAGNYWMETLEAQNKPEINYLIYIGLGLILVLVVVILWIIFRRKAKT